MSLNHYGIILRAHKLHEIRKIIILHRVIINVYVSFEGADTFWPRETRVSPQFAWLLDCSGSRQNEFQQKEYFIIH